MFKFRFLKKALFRKSLSKDSFLLIFLLIIAFLLRIYLVTVGSLYWDMVAFKNAMFVLNNYSWKLYYKKIDLLGVGYLPIIPLIFYLLGKIYITFFNQFFTIDTPIDNSLLYLLKFPPILFDCLIGLLIYLYISNKKKALLTAALFLFNPAIFFLSSVWGQYGSLYMFTLIISIYLLTKKNWSLSLFILSISLIVKPQTLVVVPIFLLIIFYYYRNLWKFLKSILFSLIPFTIIIPFSEGNPIIWLINYFKELSSVKITPHITAKAYNFWALVSGFEKPITFLYRGPSLRYWAMGLFLLFYGSLVVILFHKLIKKEAINYYFYFALIYFVYFLFAPQVHERYLMPTVALLAIISLNNRRYLIYYLLLSLTFFVNLSLILKNFIMPQYQVTALGILSKPMLELMKNWGTKASLLNLFIFFIMYHDFLLNSTKNEDK